MAHWLMNRLRWFRCPEHGPYCVGGRRCCCRDLHRGRRKVAG